MFATGVTIFLAEWIIDDTCLVFFSFDDCALTVTFLVMNIKITLSFFGL